MSLSKVDIPPSVSAFAGVHRDSDHPSHLVQVALHPPACARAGAHLSLLQQVSPGHDAFSYIEANSFV